MEYLEPFYEPRSLAHAAGEVVNTHEKDFI